MGESGDRNGMPYSWMQAIREELGPSSLYNSNKRQGIRIKTTGISHLIASNDLRSLSRER